MEYTKGEWKLRQIRSGQLEVVADNKTIALIAQATKPEDAPEVLANAHLIVASPKLLEACKDALRTFEARGIRPVDPRYLRLKEALAEVEGNDV